MNVNEKLKRAVEAHRAGRLAEAETACRAIVAKRPESVDALNLLGMIAVQRDDLESAAGYFRRAAALVSDNAIILSNLAETLRLQRKPEQAVPLLRQVVALKPGFAEGHLKLAVALIDARQPDEALAACRAGLVVHPRDHNLNGLAAVLLIERRSREAIPYLLAALTLAPKFDRHWEQLGQLLSFTSSPPSEDARRLLVRALSHPSIRPGDIAASIAETLLADPSIAEWSRLAGQGALPRGAALQPIAARLAADDLLRTLMESAVIPSVPLERLLTAVRRELLLDVGHGLAAAQLGFAAALAIQAFLTEYAWAVTAEEEAASAELARRVEEALHNQTATANALLPTWITLIAAYRPLHGLKSAQRILELRLPPELGNLLRVQVREPLEERALRTQIPALTPISNRTSQDVRAQYEENPYPRWVRAGRTPDPVSLPQFIPQLGGQAPADATFATPEVLIAGCGTGQHSVSTAALYRNARVVAVDLSLASLAYAVRKTRELGITNIDYQQADILELGGRGLEQRFHVIESCGVLHHLADPIAGWRVLVGLLRAGGIMNIALYSEIARRAVVTAREYIASQGYQPTAADIRRLRQDVLSRPDGDPLAALRGFRDLFNVSECRDLLFHVQEHRFTLPQIGQAIADLGLRFLGFRYPPRAGDYRRQFPDDPRMLSLDHWHVFEQANPGAFVGMYNFWVQKI